MLSQKLIATDITPALPNDSGMNAMSLMDEFKVSHLAVVDNGRYLGLISEDDIWNMHNEEKSIDTILQKLSRPFVTLENDVFEIVRIVNEQNLTLIPVLENERYIGAITVRSILKALSSIVAMQSEGGVLILEMSKEDYSMSEIAQIVEGNNAKILSSYVTNHPDSNKIKVTLKLNVSDLNPLVQTFERYEYTITAHYDQSDFTDSLHDRYNSLMRYLNT
ncbi:MAG: CBS domain-containing protein [Rhodobacteraceae bacterium]|nr:CBS domain-containing protein [Paracoccaceae bacterium]